MSRLSKLRAYMEENCIDVCVFRHAENVFLMSGYWPRNGYTFYVVSRYGEPMLVAAEALGNDPRQGIVKDVRHYGFIRIKDGNHYDNIEKIIRDYRDENGIEDDAKIAVDTGFDVISVPVCAGEIAVLGEDTMSMIKRSFATHDIISAKSAVVELRAVKDKSDIEKLEIANELGIMTCQYFEELVQAGTSEIEIAAKLEAFFAVKASGYKGSRYGKAWVQISSGSKTADQGWYIGVVSENRVIESGEMVMLEMGGVVDGYWCDLTHVCVAGGPSQKQAEVMTIVKEAQQKAIAFMKPGVVASDAYQVAMDHIQSKGYGAEYIHGLGHGLGFCYHEAVPGLGPGSGAVLQEGMVMSCEPGIYIEGEFGVRWESNVLITGDGAKVLGL